MNAFWASENFEAFIVVRSSQPRGFGSENSSQNWSSFPGSDQEELAETLKGNFDKVVHRGRRADAIVKNMLQHSPEGSGEHRIIDINALVEERLNLAWHGARAETQGFAQAIL
jgi:two-component system, NtrC family, sensor kinase